MTDSSNTKYYKLVSVEIPAGLGIFAAAAFLDCSICGKTISSCGGPVNGAICTSCGDKIKKGWAYD